jgi:hypothetical protein
MVFVELTNLNRPSFSCFFLLLAHSETSVDVRGLLLAEVELDLGASAPLFGLAAFGLLALELGQVVEVGVQLLRVVLVVVHAQLVVVSGLVLPLAVGLDREQLHEGANFDLVVVLHQLALIQEEAIVVVLLRGLDRAPLGIVGDLFRSVIAVVSVFVIALTLFSVISVVVVAFSTVRSIVLGLNIGSGSFKNALERGRGSIDGTVLHLFQDGHLVDLGVGLLLDGGQPGDVVNGQGAGELVPSDKVLLVVGHVDGREEGVHEVLEVFVGLVHLVLRQAADLAQVVELDRVTVHANVLQEGAHVTVCGLVQVGEHTVLHLGVVQLFLPGANFLVHLVPEQVLVAKQVLHLALINGHTLRISVVHSLALVTVSVLEGVVFIFAHLGELLGQLLGGKLRNELFFGGAVLDHVNEGLHFEFLKCGQEGHHFCELLLGVRVSFELGAATQVHDLDVGLKLLRLSIDVFEELRGEVLLIVKLSDLVLVVLHYAHVVVPLHAVHLLEDLHFSLLELRLGKLRALSHVERQGEQLLAVRRVKGHLVDGSPVLCQGLLQLGHSGFVRDGHRVVTIDLVNEMLERDWVSVGGFKVLVRDEGDVLKTVNFTEAVENFIEVLAHALDLEKFRDVEFLGDLLHEVVDEFGFRKRIGRVGGQVVEQLLLGSRGRLHIFKNAEARNVVELRGVDVVAHAGLALGELAEEAGGQLGSAVVARGEGGDAEGMAHPGLAEDALAAFENFLERAHLVSGKGTAGRAPHHFDALNLHQFVDLL